MRITPKDLMKQTFRVTFRGFDPVEVDGFLKRVSDELERLAEEKANLEVDLEVERASRKSLEETLESTAQLNAQLAEKAKEQGRLIVERARLDAMRMKDEADRTLAELSAEITLLRQKRASALAEMAALSDGLKEWARRFERVSAGGIGEAAPEAEAARGEDVDFVLHDARSDMLMDLVENPDTFNPGAPKPRSGPSADLDGGYDEEPIEIIDDLPAEKE